MANDEILVDPNATLHVHAVHVHGLKYTSSDYIQQMIKPILPSLNLNDLISNTNIVHHQLSSLGIFKSIFVEYDYQEPLEQNGGVVVKLIVEEAPRIVASASTGVKGVNGYFDVSGKLRNLNGKGLNLESSLSYGILDTQELKAESKPSSFLFSCLLSRLSGNNKDSIGIFNESQKMDWSGISYFSHGIECKRSWRNSSNYMMEFLYNLSWRQIHSVHDNVPWRIRKDAGHSLKSSFGYSFSIDKRDDSLLPTNGSFGKLFLEFAGLGGDVKHLKTEFTGQVVKSLKNLNFSSSLKSGFLFPLDNSSQNRINDRFLLGGPTTIRGFKQYGIGPKENNLTLGGDIFWAIGTSLFTPIPFLNDDIFKIHFFTNAASLVSMDNRDSNQILSQLSLPSVSSGVGLLVRFSSIRFELNYCVPVAARAFDQVARGLQFGVGLEFLKRYDRQLRLWQSHGQVQLEESSLCLLKVSSLGSEILKNLVLPGIGSFTIVDGRLADAESGFFIKSDNQIKTLAEQSLPYLLELNEEVKGIAVNLDPSHIIKHEIDFFKKFSLIIATDLEEDDLLKLGEYCYSHQIPLVIVRICGFYGCLRVVIPEICVMETHPEQIFDLRLDLPFKELQDYVDVFSFKELDSQSHGNVPFGIILLKVVQQWKKEFGQLPAAREEKNELKARILKLKQMHPNDSENFDEALSFAYRAWTPTVIPTQILKILSDPKAKNLDKNSKPFWILVKVLSDFVALNGVLPLSGIIPDMKADTESFIYLQKLYHSKSKKDIEWFKTKVHQTCDTLGISPERIPDDLIERFCKNASSLSVIRTSSLSKEYSANDKSKLYSNYLSESDNHFVFYILFRALDKFRAIHHRYPGDHFDNVDPDIGSLRKCLNGILLDHGMNQSIISDDYVQEFVRAGGGQLPGLAGIMGGIASQEIIKLITSQYIPLNNTFVFNGVISSSATFEL